MISRALILSLSNHTAVSFLSTQSLTHTHTHISFIHAYKALTLKHTEINLAVKNLASVATEINEISLVLYVAANAITYNYYKILYNY